MSTSEYSPGRKDLWFYTLGQVLLFGLFCLLCYFLENSFYQEMTQGQFGQEILQYLAYLEIEALGPLKRIWVLFLPVLLASLAFLLLQRLRFAFLGLMGVVILLLFIADRIYFQFFSALVSMRVMTGAGQLWDIRSSIYSQLTFHDLLYLLGFLGIGTLGWFLSGRVKVSIRNHLLLFVSERLVGIFLFGYSIHLAMVAFHLPLLAQGKAYSDTGGAANFFPPYMTSSRDFGSLFGTVNFHIKDVFGHYLTTTPDRELEAAELELLHYVLDDRYRVNSLPSEVAGIAKGRNVVVISLEAFQSFLIDLKIDGIEITPNLNRLYQSSFRFDYALDSVSRGGTSDAEFSVLTGLFPDNRQAISLGLKTTEPLKSLSHSLKDVGYHTFSYHGYKRAFWNRNVNHPYLGIDKMVFIEDFEEDQISGFGLKDELVFERASKDLAVIEDPYFCFLISLTSHHPYNYARGHSLNISMPDSMARDYLVSVNYTDMILGQFMDDLKTNGQYEQTIFVLYGDHRAALDEVSEELMEKSIGVKARSPREARIPLVIAVPGEEAVIAEHAERYRHKVTGLQDVYPSVLQLLGQDIPPGLFGTSLFVEEDNRRSLPFYRASSAIAFRGAVYKNMETEPMTDEHGIVWREPDGGTPSKDVLQDAFSWVSKTFMVHELIFDHAGQSSYLAVRNDFLARDLEAQKTSQDKSSEDTQ